MKILLPNKKEKISNYSRFFLFIPNLCICTSVYTFETNHFNLMKKIRLSLSFLLLLGGFVNAQNIITTSGSFTNNGQPKPFEIITLYYYSLDSSTTAVVIDSAITDAQGNYSLAKDLPFIYSQGYVKAVTTDCANSFQSKIENFNPLKRNLNIDFTCPILNCNNYFYFNVDTIFNNNFLVTFNIARSFGPQTVYVWDFGDGTISQGANISHNYSQSGMYTVCLTTIDSLNNCTSVFCDSIFINNPFINCYASFAAYTNPISLSVDFNAYYKSDSNAVFVWSFGDGTIATGVTTNHTYTTQGLFNVCLNVIDSINNCYSSYCNSVIVGTPILDSCLAEFKMFMLPDSLKLGASNVYFSLLNYTFGTTAYWNFGDGNTAVTTGQSVVHSYAAQGAYNITVITVDTIAQCTDTVIKQIIIDGGVLKIVALGVERNSIELYNAYPNPVSELLYLTINSLENQILTIKLLDLMGRVLTEEKLNASTGFNKIGISTAQLSNGMYIVEINSTKGKTSTKIIKN